MKKFLLDKYRKNSDIIMLCLCVSAVLIVLWSFTGHWPWKGQPYISYILQAQSWLKGRLDLGQDYPYLELAVFNNKYFVSFPPFPSYVFLPFVMIGWKTCDSAIAYLVSLMGIIYAYKLSLLVCKNRSKQFLMLLALFATIGSNWLLTAQNAWVWFIAQNMAFTLSLMSLYYAVKNKAGLSLALWACAVGCRPLQIFYIPLIIYLLYKAHMKENPGDSITDIIKKRWSAAVPMLVIAVSYMILNYARFGSIAEFGHTYLPEYTKAADGQHDLFNIKYIATNIKRLFRLPSVGEGGKISYPPFDGMCLIIASPIFISYLVYTIRSFIKKSEKTDIWLSVIIIVFTVMELLAVMAHKTMGGAQFGNRYTNDVIPMIFFGILCTAQKNDKLINFNCPLFFFGLAINILGSISFFTM